MVVRSQRLLIGWTVVVAIWAGGCSECDDIAQCDEACEEEYPEGSNQRAACYLQCSEAQLECEDRRR